MTGFSRAGWWFDKSWRMRLNMFFFLFEAEIMSALAAHFCMFFLNIPEMLKLSHTVWEKLRSPFLPSEVEHNVPGAAEIKLALTITCQSSPWGHIRFTFHSVCGSSPKYFSESIVFSYPQYFFFLVLLWLFLSSSLKKTNRKLCENNFPPNQNRIRSCNAAITSTPSFLRKPS